MHTVISLIFLSFVPTLIVLGHDTYLYYQNQDQGFMLSAIGFFLVKYIPDMQNMLLTSWDAETTEIIQAILARKAVELTAAIGVILTSLVVVIKVLFMLLSSAQNIRVRAKRRQF